MRYFMFLILLSGLCYAVPDSVQKQLEDLKKENARLSVQIKTQEIEIQRLRGLCAKSGIDPNEKAAKVIDENLDWQVVGDFGYFLTVCVDKKASKNKSFIAQILATLDIKYGKRTVWFFDDPKFTPQNVPMTDSQMLHWIGVYEPFVKEPEKRRFQYIKIKNAEVSPPELEFANTSIRPGYYSD